MILLRWHTDYENGSIMKMSVDIAIFLCALMPVSCIRDKFADCPQELLFSISVENRFTLADDPISRTPIYSAQTAQSITDVRIHVFRTPDGGATHTYVRSFDISTSWRGGTASATHNVPRAEMLESGSYRFLAVGMDAATDFSGPGYNIFNIDLRTQGDTNPADGLRDGSAPPDGVVKLPATTLAGAYLLPGMYSSGNPTMTLSLVGVDGTTVLKSWTVFDISNLANFYLWPNYFYSLGRKLQPGNTNNGTPGDPNDDDAPLDLSRAQVMTVDTSDGWGNIYPMSLRDN